MSTSCCAGWWIPPTPLPRRCARRPGSWARPSPPPAARKTRNETAHPEGADMASSSKALIEHYFAVLTGERSDRPLGEFFAEDVVWHAQEANLLNEPNPQTCHAEVMDLNVSGVGEIG